MSLASLHGSFFGNKVLITFVEDKGDGPLNLPVITSIEFDASLEEEHTLSVDITDHPVEDGSTMSDHRLQKPREFSLTAIITNTPPALGAFFRYDNVATRDVDSWTLLKRMAKVQDLLSIRTTLDSYENMVIKEMSVPRTAALGNSLEVTITFREIFTAESEEVVAPEEKEGTAKGKKKLGDGKGKGATGRKHTVATELFSFVTGG